MVGPADALPADEQALVERYGVLGPMSGAAEVYSLGQDVAVVWSQQVGPIRQVLLVEGDRPVELAGQAIGPGELATGLERLEMVRAQQPEAVGEHPFAGIDRGIQPARRTVKTGQRGPGPLRIRMPRPLNLFALGEAELGESSRVVEPPGRLARARQSLLESQGRGVRGAENPTARFE